MKRQLPIIVIVLFVVALLGWSNIIWQQQEAAKAERIRESERHLVVYSDMPEDVNAVLMTYFRDRTDQRVQIITMTDADIQKSLYAASAVKSRPDIVIATQPVLQQSSADGLFKPYASTATETVHGGFKQTEGYWNGLWIDPVVFVVGEDYFVRQGKDLHTWDDLLDDPDMRIAFPDLAATDMAGDFLCSFVETRGQDAAGRYFRELQHHIPAYSKNFAPIVRRVAGGEVDVGVTDIITARQYMQDQMPIRVLYPQDGTSYWLVGVALTQWCDDEELASSFIDWLYSEDVPIILRKKHMRVAFASDALPKELDSQGQQLVLFPVQKNYTVKGRKELQDWWIKTIRFGKE